METTSNQRWFAVHTLPRREATAILHLGQQGFETFLPRMVVSRRHARKFELVSAAFFPRYAFVRLDLARHRWRAINGTCGVHSLVMAHERPCPIPEGIVEDLIARSGPDGTLKALDPFKPGDPVRIVDGPLAGQFGTLLRLDEKGRVELLLALMSSSVRARTTQDMLEPAM